MKASYAGMLAGILLALVGAIGGWASFLVALVLGAVGFAVGAQLEGTIDVRAITRGGPRG